MKKYQWLVVMICFLISGCAASQTMTEPSQPESTIICQEPRPEICTMDYRPVCGTHQDDSKKTYSNACSACANPDVISYVPGACPDS